MMHLHIWLERGPPCDTEESPKILISHQVVDQLSPHHDSQFLAFSTEVLARMNQIHNRSSSPFTTLAEQMESKVANIGAGQPNYWPKTLFGADAYNAKLGTLTYAIKLFGLSLNDTYVAVSGNGCRGMWDNTEYIL